MPLTCSGQGVYPKIASERLGHSTIAITLDLSIYEIASLGDRKSCRVFEASVEGEGSQDNTYAPRRLTRRDGPP